MAIPLKTKVLIVAGVLLVILAGGFYLLYNEINILASTRSTYLQKQQILEEKQKQLNDINKLLENYNEVLTQAKKASYVLPSKEDVPELISQISALAKESEIAVSDINFSEPRVSKKTATQEYSVLKITMTAVGSYENLKKFIKKLEVNIRIVDITSIDFSNQPVTPEAPTNIFSYVLGMQAYYLK